MRKVEKSNIAKSLYPGNSSATPEIKRTLVFPSENVQQASWVSWKVDQNCHISLDNVGLREKNGRCSHVSCKLMLIQSTPLAKQFGTAMVCVSILSRFSSSNKRGLDCQGMKHHLVSMHPVQSWYHFTDGRSFADGSTLGHCIQSAELTCRNSQLARIL